MYSLKILGKLKWQIPGEPLAWHGGWETLIYTTLFSWHYIHIKLHVLNDMLSSLGNSNGTRM